MRREGRIRTSVRDSKSKTSEPYGRISDGSEGLLGGKEEVSGDGVGRSGELDQDVSERRQVPEAGSAGNRFGKEN